MSTTTTTSTTTATADARAERRAQYHEADVVVVGAGIFGCAVAYAMGQQGRSVLLLERWMKEPDRIVGELLQPGGVAALRKLGLGHCLEGIDSIPCYGFDVTFHGESCNIPFPSLDENGRRRHLAGHAMRMPRRPTPRRHRVAPSITDASSPTCAARAKARKNITVVETEVTGMIRGEESDQVLGVTARTINPSSGEKEADYFFGQLTIIADGYASKFRKDLIPQQPVVKSKFYALELVDAPLPSPRFGHVFIGGAYPVLMYQIGSHETRALIDVPANIPEAAPAAGGVRGYISNCVLPSLPPQLQPCVAAALEDGKIPRSMPNSWLPPSRQPRTQGVLLLGDAMNMRHPLTGGGMTVAFNDAVLVTDLLHPDVIPDLGDGAAVRRAMDTFHWRRKSLTCIINVLAQALYSLFAADDRLLRALQKGCFDYFKRGHATVPMGLMGGLIQRPAILAYHFFTVAFVAIWINACDLVSGPLGFLKAPLAAVDAILILWKASMVFLPLIFREAQ
ncbi:squalene monooxygenase [Verticillium alfalfae VaMs.102]|uniref:Squalene monooxygenase n=1 Tax=Verticillium alfalfae (strain VaMs.102 / ATCC MYA-4576 / FGSC 10136) TaxID=526221 RepID=C9SAT5_VERA1|nr:squalene monooxygenase [Verticillium alfalfae VaMs.102]EEY15509.1 squalene monooxygenase [Verticillium alfalfae VaMs.102]